MRADKLAELSDWRRVPWKDNSMARPSRAEEAEAVIEKNEKKKRITE
jgi:hypothetical protein